MTAGESSRQSTPTWPPAWATPTTDLGGGVLVHSCDVPIGPVVVGLHRADTPDGAGAPGVTVLGEGGALGELTTRQALAVAVALIDLVHAAEGVYEF